MSKTKRSMKLSLGVGSLLTLTLLTFQNCGKVQFADAPVESQSLSSTDEPPAQAECSFDGKTLYQGDSVTAYLASSVAPGQTCKAETRTCQSGALSGSYSYATCEVNAPQACLFNGSTIPHGDRVTAFLNSSASSGSSCLSESRICQNGVLSGTYQYASCQTQGTRSCLFDGRTIASGQSVVGYLSSSVAAGEFCQSQYRTCSDGQLNGSYSYSSCQVAQPQACYFNGQTIPHGSSVNAFASSSVPYGQSCSSQSRYCNNGVLSGSYSYASCDQGVGSSCLFNGQTVADGQKVLAYRDSRTGPGELFCTTEYRTCSNGTLSGSYQYSSCVRDFSCTFNGQRIEMGAGVVAYESPVAINGQCRSEYRTCGPTLAVLSGSFAYSSCTPY